MLLQAELCPDLTADPNPTVLVSDAGGVLSVPPRRSACSLVGRRFGPGPQAFDLCTSVRPARTARMSRKLYALLIHRYLHERLAK